MITAVSVSGLRGIREGRLDGLAPLSILTGFNGGGKSALLDALLIGASREVGDAIGRAIRRHTASQNGAQWLFYARGDRAATTIERRGSSLTLARYFQRYDYVPSTVRESLRERASQQLRKPFTTIVCARQKALVETDAAAVIDAENEYVQEKWGLEIEPPPFVRLIDPGLPIKLNESFSRLTQAGRKDALLGWVRRSRPRLADLLLLSELDGSGRVSLFLSEEGASVPVPVALSGDGLQSQIQTAVELFSVPAGGVALLEEPEVYQHPRALNGTAAAIVGAVLHGIQVVLTTHSAELIERILAEASAQALPASDLGQWTVGLDDGRLLATHRTGEDLVHSVREMELDVR